MPAAPMWALAPSPSQAIFDGGRVLAMEQKHVIAALTVAAAPASGTAPDSQGRGHGRDQGATADASACRK